MIKRLTVPIENEKHIRELEAGDFVKLNGILYTARDQVHKRLIEMLERGEKLPFDLKNIFLYYSAPTPIRPDNKFGSAGPTTASRMDKLTEPLLRLGLKGTIGKGERSPEMNQLFKRYGAIYCVAFGGAGAYLANQIVSQELIAFPELGPEAVYRLEVVDFPVVVAIDSFGKSIF